MGKKKIAVLTATRAEFGLLKPVISRLFKDSFFETELLVTGMHLSDYFGSTYQEIEEAGFPIKYKVDIDLNSDTTEAITHSFSIAVDKFGRIFAEDRPDVLLVLGDRYEILAVCISAMLAGIPIAHICGGEISEGAIDDAIRHSITKMSCMHFTATEMYRKRVIQLGEQPSAVYNVGDLSVENIQNTEFLTKEQLSKNLGVQLKPQYGVVTFHPVTLEDIDTAKNQTIELLHALEKFPEFSFIFTKANADRGGRVINETVDQFAQKHKNIICVDSLGVQRYLSALKYSCFMIGNSSSGVTEAPGLEIPTINIGNRQKGRYMPDSVICCEPDTDSIVKAMRYSLTDEFRNVVHNMKKLYGDGNTSEYIVEILKNELLHGTINLKKHFYDLFDMDHATDNK